MPDPRTVFLTDQLQAEVKDRAHAELEAALHAVGMCSADFDMPLASLVDAAVMCGANAMGVALHNQGLLKGVGE